MPPLVPTPTNCESAPKLEATTQSLSGRHLVLFDSDCRICDTFVQLLLTRDVQARLLFAPLSGKAASSILKAYPEHGARLIDLSGRKLRHT